MKSRYIISPMAKESGAYIVHQHLERNLKEYRLMGYNPYWTLIPLALPLVAQFKRAKLVHTTPDHAIFFYRKSVPLILTFHNYVLDRWMRQYSTWCQQIHYATDLRLWTKLALSKAHALTAVSYYTARLIQKDLKLSKDIKVIYNGVDANHFTPATSSRPARKEVRVLFSGNLARRKGAPWLPLIAKQLQKNVRIYYTQGLRTQNNLAANSKLQPLGSVPFKDMANRYRQMDLLVMPSVREGFGLAVAEAMSCGLPVVASNCSAIPELIDDGKGGFLCPVGDVKTFADKINLLADSPKLRREMGEYNRAKVEKMFTLDRMVKEYQDLFQEVLG
jgi:glycosyltransferase involved in cell wall biosynthesis